MPSVVKNSTIGYALYDRYKRKCNYYTVWGVYQDNFDGYLGAPIQRRSKYGVISKTTPANWPWKELIRNHRNATTVLDGTYAAIEEDGSGYYSRCDWSARDPRKGGGTVMVPMYDEIRDGLFYSQSEPTFPSSINISQSLSSQAKMKLYQQIREKSTAFEGGVFLGELAETIRMLRRPLSGIREGMGDYLRTVKKRAHRTPTASLNRMVAGTWLEYVFGWTPLLSDLDSASEALESIHNRYEDVYQRFHVQVDGDNVLTYGPVKGSLAMGLSRVDRSVWKRQQSSIKYYGQVYVAAASSQSIMRQHWGLTLNDFIPTVWELIPYSFLVDYFSNTGKIISALNTYTGGVSWISMGTKSTERVYHAITGVPVWNISSWASPIKIHSQVFVPPNRLVLAANRVNRQPTTVPVVNPFTDFRLKVPGVGSMQWLNITALLSSSRKTEKLLRS